MTGLSKLTTAAAAGTVATILIAGALEPRPPQAAAAPTWSYPSTAAIPEPPPADGEAPDPIAAATERFAAERAVPLGPDGNPMTEKPGGGLFRTPPARQTATAGTPTPDGAAADDPQSKAATGLELG